MTILFDDRKQWQLEADFRFKEGVGSGEVEIDKCKRKAYISIKLILEPPYQNKTMDIFIDGQQVYTVEGYMTADGSFFSREKYKQMLPKKVHQ
jgi:hypothetical protein